jgi:hypothetical protein
MARPHKPIDYTGRKIGTLTITHRAPNRGEIPCWFADCDCGMEGVVVQQYKFHRDNSRVSCGCLQLEEKRKLGRRQSAENREYRWHCTIHPLINDYLTKYGPPLVSLR